MDQCGPEQSTQTVLLLQRGGGYNNIGKSAEYRQVDKEIISISIIFLKLARYEQSYVPL